MRLRKQPQPQPPVLPVPEEEARLDEAELRVKSLHEKAEWLRAIVIRRDQENHWQASVNQLFQGGRS